MKVAATFTRALLLTLLLPIPMVWADDPEETPKRKTVYVPFDKLDDIFEKNDRGIYMSYKEFLELMKKAQHKPETPKLVEDKPPADWVMVSAGYGGEVKDKVVHFSGVFAVEVLKKKGWVTVPLNIDNIAFSKVRVKGKDAIIKRDKRAGYSLLMQGSGSPRVEGDFVVPINDQTPGERSFTFRLPEAAISSFKVRLPEKGLRVEVKPSLSVKTRDDGEQTVVTAYLKSGGNITVRWWPRPKEVKGQKALLYADTTTVMRCEEGVVRTATKVRYRIHQASTQTFDLAFPKEYKILSVTGKNIEGWVPSAKSNGFQVKLRSPVERGYELTFRLERIVSDITQELVFPNIHTLNTERETGTACIIGSKLLKLKVGTQEGATQITMNKEQIPADLVKSKELANFGAPLAFHTKKNFKLSVNAKRVEPEVTGVLTTLATVRDSDISVRTLIRYIVKRRGIFSVKIQLPQGFSLLECGDERSVKDYRIQKGVLEVEFPNQVLNNPYELLITGQMARKKTDKFLNFPVFKLLNVKKETGQLAVAALKHLELTTEKSAGVIPVNTSQVLSRGIVTLHSSMRRVPSNTRMPVDAKKEDFTLAFKYAKPGGSAVIGIKKRKPKIDATVEILANAEEDLLKIEGTINYKIKYAGVDVFRLEVPAAVKDLKIEGIGIKEKSKKTVDNKIIHTIKTQSKRLNNYSLKFRYEDKFADLPPGAEEVVPLFPVTVLDVANQRGNLALVKHENLVIREVPDSRKGLEIRDVSELPSSLNRANVFRAYRYLGKSFTLQLRVIKYDFKAPLGTLINHLHLDEIVTNAGMVQTEAWILLQNNSAQFLRVHLPKKAIMRALRVAGNKKRWSETKATGDFNEILINLASHAGKTEPFVIRLRYDVSIGANSLGSTGSVAFNTPSFPIGKKNDKSVPITNFTRQVIFGPDVATLDFDTDMTKHFEAQPGLWTDLKSFVFTPMGRQRRVYEIVNTIQALKRRDRFKPGTGGLYSELKNAALITPNAVRYEKLRLFSKLNGSAKLTVGYTSWTWLFTKDVLCFLAVIFAGLFFDKKKLLNPSVFFAVATGSALVLATFTEGSFAHFMRSAVMGGVALGAVWLAQGLWRELTVNRQQRLIDVLQAETHVARARAAAAEAEARRSGIAPVSADKTGSVAVSLREVVTDRPETETKEAVQEQSAPTTKESADPKVESKDPKVESKEAKVESSQEQTKSKDAVSKSKDTKASEDTKVSKDTKDTKASKNTKKQSDPKNSDSKKGN